jgi:hypothetical protein
VKKRVTYTKKGGGLIEISVLLTSTLRDARLGIHVYNFPSALTNASPCTDRKQVDHAGMKFAECCFSCN